MEPPQSNNLQLSTHPARPRAHDLRPEHRRQALASFACAAVLVAGTALWVWPRAPSGAPPAAVTRFFIQKDIRLSAQTDDSDAAYFSVEIGTKSNPYGRNRGLVIKCDDLELHLDDASESTLLEAGVSPIITDPPLGPDRQKYEACGFTFVFEKGVLTRAFSYSPPAPGHVRIKREGSPWEELPLSESAAIRIFGPPDLVNEVEVH